MSKIYLKNGYTKNGSFFFTKEYEIYQTTIKCYYLSRLYVKEVVTLKTREFPPVIILSINK